MLTQYPEKADDATEVLRFAVQEFPDSSFPHYSLARLYRERGDIGQAIVHCQKCLELEPTFGDAAELLRRLESQRE